MSIDYSHLFELMKEKGLTTYRIRKEKIISETTLQKLREGKVVTTEAIDKLCCALNCQPGDIMEYIPEVKKEGLGNPSPMSYLLGMWIKMWNRNKKIWIKIF